jgi:excisionase family DNA binding protein
LDTTKLAPISVAEAATRLGLTPRHTRSLIAAGAIPRWKVGRLIRLNSPNVNVFLDRVRSGP